MAWNYNAAKEWRALGDWDLTPSEISYNFQINGRTLQGESNRMGVQREGDTAGGGTHIDRGT